MRRKMGSPAVNVDSTRLGRKLSVRSAGAMFGRPEGRGPNDDERYTGLMIAVIYARTSTDQRGSNERGDRQPSMRILQRLAKALGVPTRLLE